MSGQTWRSARRLARAAGVCLVAVSPLADGRTCPDGEHPPIDVREISLRYETSGIEATLSGLGVLGVQVAVSPKTLQQAAVATQKMNEFIKALVAGYNACAVTRAQYQEALEQLMPSLRGDANQLEQFRRQLLADQQVDRKRFNAVLEQYERNLRRMAQISRKELDYERIEAVVDERVRTHVETGTSRVLEGQNQARDEILRRLNQLESRMSTAPLPTPQDVDAKISALKARLLSATERAETEYREGYRLIERYRFREAIPHLERAAAAVPLPEFYLALGRGYEELGAYDKAERALREGIARARDVKDAEAETRLAGSLMLVVINGAGREDFKKVSDTMDMLQKLDRNAWPKALEAAVDQEDIKNSMAVVMIMRTNMGPTGSYEALLKYRADAAARYGEKDPHVAMYDMLRVMLITFELQSPARPAVPPAHRLKADAAQTEALSRQALAVNESAYGPVHPRIALSLGVLGGVLAMQGRYDSALSHMQRALVMIEQIWGPDHVNAATQLMGIANVHARRGQWDEASANLRRARVSFERAAGTNSLSVRAIDLRLEQLQKMQKEQSAAGKAKPPAAPVAREPQAR